MLLRSSFLALAALAGGLSLYSARAQSELLPAAPNHVAWVVECLKRMTTIKPGMTRSQLLTVFTVEGGISTRLERTYVSRDCPYFKVDVTFKPIEGPEDVRDVIVSISRPYLAFMHID